MPSTGGTEVARVTARAQVRHTHSPAAGDKNKQRRKTNQYQHAHMPQGLAIPDQCLHHVLRWPTSAGSCWPRRPMATTRQRLERFRSTLRDWATVRPRRHTHAPTQTVRCRRSSTKDGDRCVAQRTQWGRPATQSCRPAWHTRRPRWTLTAAPTVCRHALPSTERSACSSATVKIFILDVSSAVLDGLIVVVAYCSAYSACRLPQRRVRSRRKAFR